MHGYNNNMGSNELIAATYTQAQTNFNGLVQLAEAETNFQREVYKRLKSIDERFDQINTMLDKIYKECKDNNGNDKPEEEKMPEIVSIKMTKKTK